MGDVVAEIFRRPTLCFVCVVWHGTVTLPDVGSYSIHHLAAGQHNLLQTFYVGFHVDSEATWED